LEPIMTAVVLTYSIQNAWPRLEIHVMEDSTAYKDNSLLG